MPAEELLNPVRIAAIFLAFVRIGAMMVAAPFFSHKAFPVKVKIFFSILLAWIVIGYVTPPSAAIIANNPAGWSNSCELELSVNGGVLTFNVAPSTQSALALIEFAAERPIS